MNLNKITYRIFRDFLVINKGNEVDDNKIQFVVKMMISLLTDEQKESVLDEMMNEKEHIEFKKRDIIWFDPKDNQYDLKNMYPNDILKDALLMTDEGYIKGTIINDNSYRDTCSPYATEYKVMINSLPDYTMAGRKDYDVEPKEIRVKRSNIIRLWSPIKDLE
jgi:hypothetical protein